MTDSDKINLIDTPCRQELTLTEFDSLSLSPKQREQFEQYYQFLVSENEKYNLTAITDKTEVFCKHFFDSLAAIPFIKDNASICDVGCGAGFPSLPLVIVRKDIKATLLDATQKKVNFCQLLCEKLNLSEQVTCLHCRAEEFTQREHFDYVLARAVAPINTLLEYCAPFVKVGGQIVLYKSVNEMAQTDNACRLLGIEYVCCKSFDYSYGARTLLFYRKARITPLRYPRQGNLPRKSPL